MQTFNCFPESYHSYKGLQKAAIMFELKSSKRNTWQVIQICILWNFQKSRFIFGRESIQKSGKDTGKMIMKLQTFLASFVKTCTIYIYIWQVLNSFQKSKCLIRQGEYPFYQQKPVQVNKFAEIYLPNLWFKMLFLWINQRFIYGMMTRQYQTRQQIEIHFPVFDQQFSSARNNFQKFELIQANKFQTIHIRHVIIQEQKKNHAAEVIISKGETENQIKPYFAKSEIKGSFNPIYTLLSSSAKGGHRKTRINSRSNRKSNKNTSKKNKRNQIQFTHRFSIDSQP